MCVKERSISDSPLHRTYSMTYLNKSSRKLCGPNFHTHTPLPITMALRAMHVIYHKTLSYTPANCKHFRTVLYVERDTYRKIYNMGTFKR